MRPCAIEAIGEKLERSNVGEIGRVDPAGEIDPPLERNRHRTPLAVECGSIFGQGLHDRNGHAIDMDMQLLLAARPFRIDRQSNGFPRQRPVKALLDQGLGAPGDGEHRRRVGRQHLRIFDAGDAPRRNSEHLGDADQILQNRHTLLDAAIEVDAFARLRTQTRFHMGDALAMHDPPQSIRIGAGWRGER